MPETAQTPMILAYFPAVFLIFIKGQSATNTVYKHFGAHWIGWDTFCEGIEHWSTRPSVQGKSIRLTNDRICSIICSLMQTLSWKDTTIHIFSLEPIARGMNHILTSCFFCNRKSWYEDHPPLYSNISVQYHLVGHCMSRIG